MALHDDMAEAHARDHRDQDRMRDLRLEIEAFLASPPARCHRSTVEFLRASVDGLKSDSDHIVAVWN